MQATIFSWEYPPRVVGQLADYVKELAGQLVKNGVKTYVVTYHDYLTGLHDDPEGVVTFRVANPVRTHIGVLTWVLTLNQEVERAAATVYYDVSERHMDLIDVHDWHFIPAAVTLKKSLNIPFVYSVESLEDHRSHGSNSPFNMAIKSIEWLGMYEAARLIVKSQWMGDEASRIYRVPKDKARVIPARSVNWVKEVLGVYRSVVGGIKS
jgi:glycogen(starch) synthase